MTDTRVHYTTLFRSNAVRQTGQDAGQMRGRDGVVRVGAELFGGEFPVAGDDPLLHTRDGFGAGLGTVEHVVHVELRLAQIGVQIRGDRKSTRLNSSHYCASRMPSSA